jgi:hypothetical protein
MCNLVVAFSSTGAREVVAVVVVVVGIAEGLVAAGATGGIEMQARPTRRCLVDGLRTRAKPEIHEGVMCMNNSQVPGSCTVYER